MEEFHIAHEQAVNGRRKLLIPILLGDISDMKIPDELKVYLETHTYLKVDHSTESGNAITQKKLRFAMPQTPLKDLKTLPPRREYKRIRSSTTDRPTKISVQGQ